MHLHFFRKYRVTFRLGKCEFLKDRAEYVSHDITSKGKFPSQSKFDMINDCKLPYIGYFLLSFLGFINFYHRSTPCIELRLKPFRRLCRTYYLKSIPTMAWTPDFIKLFEELKVGITSSPVLSRLDYQNINFLKTNCSTYGMVWNIMHPDNDIEYATST